MLYCALHYSEFLSSTLNPQPSTMYNGFVLSALASGSVSILISVHDTTAFITSPTPCRHYLLPRASSLARLPKSACFALPDLLPSTITIGENISAGQEAIDAVADVSITGSSFTDEISFSDPTLQTMFGVFGVAIVVLLIFSFLGKKMDSAIESVLVDFENTMRTYYASRWVEIDKELDGLDATARSVKLIAIMENLQENEPRFMEKLNRKLP